MNLSNTYLLSDGNRIPVIGYGTYKCIREGESALDLAIRAGYRLFDSASLYETERALSAAVKRSGLPRQSFFLESKLWIDEMGYEPARAALDRSLMRLQTDYLDAYMIHWPRKSEGEEDYLETLLETWRAIEEGVRQGKVKSPGVSNFLPQHLIPLLKNCSIRPVLGQLEIHPGYSQEAAVSYLESEGIRPMAWSPLARGRKKAGEVRELEILTGLGEKYHKSPAQISLRFLLQRGIIPIPRSTGEEHMRENLEIFDFSLSEEEIWQIRTMPQTAWLGEHPDLAIPKKRSRFDQ